MNTSLEERRKRGRNVSGKDLLSGHRVNHVALVIDKSGSMKRHQKQVVRVVDGFVKGLQEESDRLGHETRISLYQFDHQVECLVWDMDVKRLPSMQGRYDVDRGATALIEATVTSLADLESEVSQKYGEHSFLQVVWTDGEENASGGDMHIHMSSERGKRVLDGWVTRIQEQMQTLPGHWTSAILVPSSLAKRTAQGYGFPTGNISVWDAESREGVEEAIGTVAAAATSFLRGREKGVRGTRSLFAVGADLDITTVKSVLTPLDGATYKLLDVEEEHHDMEIRDFVQAKNISYVRGNAYYQLGPRVTVQANKNVAVYDTKEKLVHGGPDARELLFGPAGRTDGSLSVKAGHNADLLVFVQSTSVNRKLKKDTRVLVML